MAVVRGHGLRHEGAPFLVAGCCGAPGNDRARNSYDAEGHALCGCGEMSPHLSSTRRRQAWHREHKAQQPGSPGGRDMP